MLAHISLGVSDLVRSVAFYDAALGALGYARVHTDAHAAGYGRAAGVSDQLLLIQQPHAVVPPGPGFHLAFAAPTREAVAAFHAAALAAGGRDDGLPGPRPHYGESYYAAFVRDPDGYKLEAKHPPPAP
jgi:catechol 2,3-dioxygenase-like lactoylglutathione lyase family enzyme